MPDEWPDLRPYDRETEDGKEAWVPLDEDRPDYVTEDGEIIEQQGRVAPLDIEPIIAPELKDVVFQSKSLNLLDLPRDLTMAEFTGLGDQVQFMACGSPWWEGDWGNYGELVHGGSYMQAIVTEWSDPSTHGERRKVAAAFPKRLRDHSQTYEVHRVIAQRVSKAADLDAERQKWLRRAGENGWVASQVAAAIREAQVVDVDEADEFGRTEEENRERDADAFPTTVSFHVTWTVAASQAGKAELVIEDVESAGRRELEDHGIDVLKVTSKMIRR